MKSKSALFARRSLLLLPFLVLAVGGCAIFSGSAKKSDVMAAPGDESYPGQDKVPHLHIGDTVAIAFSGLPDPVDTQEKPIKEDGTITLPDIGRIKAAGKTIGELEDAIHDLYVPKIYTHLNVTVKTTSERV